MSLISLIVPENLHIKVEVIGVQSEDIKKLLELTIDNNLKIKTIMATQEEAAAQLQAVSAQLAKANTEIQAKIQELVAAAGNADSVNPALQAAIDALVPAAQALDDIVPDAPAPAPAG